MNNARERGITSVSYYKEPTTYDIMLLKVEKTS